MTAPAAAPGRAPAWWRLPFLAAGFAALFAGLHGGLARLGWDVPAPAAELAAGHGLLMVSGFFGTLISLERAVALGRPWAYLAPAASGLGAVSLVAGAAAPAIAPLFVAGAAALLAVSLVVVARQPTLFTVVLAAGAGAWLGGNLLWLAAAPMPDIVPWWALFFLLTIAGERLELTRLRPPLPHARSLFLAVLALLAGGLAVAAAGGGMRPLGFAWLTLALWLSTFDIARRTVGAGGLPRFTAICLLSGYAWLAVAGLIATVQPLEPGGGAYDAALHALFLGFVFAMVFGHAPIIFPAILRCAVPFGPRFYAPLVILNLSLVARLAGDVGLDAVRVWGGLGNGLAILLFVALVANGVRRGLAPSPVALARAPR